ncbi:hypothetical protein SUGI_0109460 [Cryptomeria japonica]|nr:hypothetical protein SUGI_0109460 [Cryptomeria japonica]
MQRRPKGLAIDPRELRCFSISALVVDLRASGLLNERKFVEWKLHRPRGTNAGKFKTLLHCGLGNQATIAYEGDRIKVEWGKQCGGYTRRNDWHNGAGAAGGKVKGYSRGTGVTMYVPDRLETRCSHANFKSENLMKSCRHQMPNIPTNTGL